METNSVTVSIRKIASFAIFFEKNAQLFDRLGHASLKVDALSAELQILTTKSDNRICQLYGQPIYRCDKRMWWCIRSTRENRIGLRPKLKTICKLEHGLQQLLQLVPVLKEFANLQAHLKKAKGTKGNEKNSARLDLRDLTDLPGLRIKVRIDRMNEYIVMLSHETKPQR